MNPMRFELLGGTFVDEFNKHYNKGDIVESFHNLEKEWKNSFRRCHSDEATAAHPPQPATAPVVWVDRPAQTPENPLSGQPEADETDDAPADAALGQDASKRFPKAVEQDFKVFKKGPKFFVYDADDLTKPLNPDGAKRDEVDAVIEKALQPE